MHNASCRWTAGIGSCLFALATLGCGSPESESAVTQTGVPAAVKQEGEEHDAHGHADGAHAEEADAHAHGKDAHEHEGHGHDEHEGHGHEGHAHEPAGADGLPADFASAVANLRPLYEAIREAFQAGDKGKADKPLHQVGHLLESLPELAGKAGLGEQELAKAKSAASAMFEAYGELDEAIHAGQEPDYGAVAEKLDKAMAELGALTKPPAAGK